MQPALAIVLSSISYEEHSEEVLKHEHLKRDG